MEQLIILHDEEWLAKQRIAGKCVAAALEAAESFIKDGYPTLIDIENICKEQFDKHNCQAAFLNFKGFPSSVCLSVNNQLVHGIPSNYKIKDNDVIKIDLGANYNGAIADSAITILKNCDNKKYHELTNTCYNSLINAIKNIKIGDQIGKIGYCINHIVKSTNFGLITNYGGHGIENNKPHAPPFIANKSQKNSGIRIQEGISLAIEPMLTLSQDTETKVSSDGWTVLTKSVSVHFEHTLNFNKNNVEIITKRKNESF